MNCPKCGKKVSSTGRVNGDGTLIITRHLCTNCMHRFETTGPNPKWKPLPCIPKDE